MSEQTVVTITVAGLAALAPTIVGLAALRTSKQNDKKADIIISKANEIHVLTNSNLARVSAALKAANSKIDHLEEVVLRMAKNRSLSDGQRHQRRPSRAPQSG